MIFKTLKAKAPGRFLRNSKFFVIGFFCFFILHNIAMNFHPTYHHKIINQLKPMIKKTTGVDLQFPNFKESDIEPEYEKYIKELGLKNPGNFGAAVVLPENISEEIKKKVEEGYNQHGFNAFVSNLISVNRDLPDTRAEECKNKSYENLPKCTVIVPFYNEEWTLLLRTVHGVINRSPDVLIEEILLVDDASDRGENKF